VAKSHLQALVEAVLVALLGATVTIQQQLKRALFAVVQTMEIFTAALLVQARKHKILNQVGLVVSVVGLMKNQVFTIAMILAT
jgi:hypothetical protein